MPGFDVASLGMQAATDVIGTGLGLALEKHNNKRQLEQQGKLQAQQIAGQQQMTDYNAAKQLQMWKDTSYSAQKEQMNKAGINPALMYGMGGGGGQTAAVSAGNVSGGSAPQGGGEIAQMTGMGMQMALLKAQKDNIEADTANKKAQTPNIGADTTNKGIQGEGMQIDNAIKKISQNVAGQTQEAAIDTIKANTQLALNAVSQAQVKTRVSEETVAAQIQQIRAEAAGAVLKNALTKMQTSKTGSDIQVNDAQISKWANEIAQGNRRLDIEDFRAVTERNFKGVDALTGNVLQGLMNSINEVLGDGGVGAKPVGTEQKKTKDFK